MNAYERRLRGLPDGELHAMLTENRADYTDAALASAAAEAARRGLDVARPLPAAPLPVTCPDCGRAAPPDVCRVFLPSDAPTAVAAFEARSCPACGRTAFYRVD